jgi:hypothetical protein
MHARLNNGQIQIFSTKLKLFDAQGNQITGLQYFKESDYASCGFKLVIEDTITDNQHLSEVIERDGKFYRDAIDNPIPVIPFNTKDAKDKIDLLFGTKVSLIPYYAPIMDNLKDYPISMEDKNFHNLNKKINAYKALGYITNDELLAFRKIFLD